MKNLSVCIITKHAHPKIGGAENQVDLLSQWMVTKGIPVTIVTRHYAKSLPTYEEREGVRIFRIKCLPGKLLGTLSFLVFGCLRLFRERAQYNVIHSHQIFSPSILGWFMARLTGYPQIINLHRGGKLGDIQRLLRFPIIGRLRLKLFSRNVNAFIAISDEIASELRSEDVPVAKIKLLDNAVDTDLFQPVESAERIRIREQLGLPLDVPICVFAGRLVQIKGLEVLLQAWKDVLPSAHLVIAGDGELSTHLQDIAQKTLDGRVSFVGSRQDVHLFLKAADIWVLPSFGEGLPVSLLEAMASALPVVVTPVGAIPDIINDQENGWLVPVGDSDQLAEALNLILNNLPHSRSVGEHARQTVLDRFGIDRVAQSYVDLFQSFTSPSTE